jgi:hypothetical protein
MRLGRAFLLLPEIVLLTVGLWLLVTTRWVVGAILMLALVGGYGVVSTTALLVRRRSANRSVNSS